MPERLKKGTQVPKNFVLLTPDEYWKIVGLPSPNYVTHLPKTSTD